MKRHFVCSLLFLLIGVLSCNGCLASPTVPTRGEHPEATGVPPLPHTVNPDTSLFATLVRYVQQGGLEQEPHRSAPDYLRVDPRVIDSTYKIQRLNEQHLASMSPARIRRRAEVLEQFGIPSVDALKYQECVLESGLDFEPLSEADTTSHGILLEPTVPKECQEKDSFYIIIFGKRHSVEAPQCTVAPPSELNKHNAPSVRECWMVSVAEYTDYSIQTYALYLLRNPQGKWEVMRKERLGWLMS